MAAAEFVLMLVIASLLLSGSTGSMTCYHDNQCGWNARCRGGECYCVQGFEFADNKRDCVDTRCDDSRCLHCKQSNSCKRCVNFIEEGTGRCLSSCDSDFALVVEGEQVGKVCSQSKGGVNLMYVAAIVGISAAILLATLIALVCYFKLKTDREREMRLKLMGKMMDIRKQSSPDSEHKDTQFIYGQQTKPDRGTSPDNQVNKLQFVHQVAALRPNMETFLQMLREAKVKYHALDPEDNKSYIFKNIIDQLCRVLGILNDPDAVVPPDGNHLLDWAYRILQQYRSAKTQGAIKWEPSPKPRGLECPEYNASGDQMSSPSSSARSTENLTANSNQRSKSAPAPSATAKHSMITDYSNFKVTETAKAMVANSTKTRVTDSIRSLISSSESLNEDKSRVNYACDRELGEITGMHVFAEFTEPIEV